MVTVKVYECPKDGCDYRGDFIQMTTHLETDHRMLSKDVKKWFEERDAADKQSLVDAAKGMGAVEVLPREKIQAVTSSSATDEINSEFNRAPNTQDIIGTGKIEFHTELPQVEFNDLVGQEFLIQDIRLIENWDGYFGTSTFGLLQIMLRDGRKATSLAGGKAIVKQLQGFRAARRFPVKVKLAERPGLDGNYRIFE